MTRDYRQVPVVGKHSVPPGYSIIDAQDRQGSIAYALFGSMILVEAKRGPMRLEECMLAIAKRQIAYYESIITELKTLLRPLALESTIIDFAFFTECFGLSQEGVLNAIHMLEAKSDPEHSITNGDLLEFMEEFFGTPTPGEVTHANNVAE